MIIMWLSKNGAARLNHGVYLRQIFWYALDKRRI